MAEDFQALLERINEEGLKKAQAESTRIVAEAKEQAAKIVADAAAEAEKIMKEAERQAELTCQKGEQSLRQASRAVLLDLRQTLEARVSKAVGALLKDSLDEKSLPEIIASLCQAYLASNGNEDNLEVLLVASQAASLESAIRAKLAEDLRARVEFSPNENLRGGFKLVFKGSDIMYDFSDASLAEAISQHVSGSIAAVITE